MNPVHHSPPTREHIHIPFQNAHPVRNDPGRRFQKRQSVML